MKVIRKLNHFHLSFTLTEFLIVIAILVTLALISIPVFRVLWPAFELSGAIRNLSTDLHYAQQLAVTEQINHGVHFTSSTNQHKYEMIKYNSTTTIIQSRTFPEKIQFHQISFSNNEVKFNPYGAAYEEGEITLINISNNETSTIEVRPSGFVRIIK